MNCTAMNEGLTLGCTIHVLRRVRGGARAGGTGTGLIPGQWQCLVCGADRCCGLPIPVVIGVLNPPLEV